MLFDDIDCDMCPADAKVFPSFAHAQVEATNEVFSHLEQPQTFLFCPTGEGVDQNMPLCLSVLVFCPHTVYYKYIALFTEVSPPLRVLCLQGPADRV